MGPAGSVARIRYAEGRGGASGQFRGIVASSATTATSSATTIQWPRVSASLGTLKPVDGSTVLTIVVELAEPVDGSTLLIAEGRPGARASQATVKAVSTDKEQTTITPNRAGARMKVKTGIARYSSS